MKLTNLALAISLATSAPFVAAQTNSTQSIAKIIADGLLVQNNLNALIRAIENQLLFALQILHPSNTTTTTISSASTTSSVTSVSSSTTISSSSTSSTPVPTFVSTPGTIQLMYPGGQMGYYGNYSNFGELGSLIEASQALQVSFLTSDGTCNNQAGGNAQMAVPGAGYLGITTGTTFNGYLFPVANSSKVPQYDSVSNFSMETTIFSVDCHTGLMGIFIDQVPQGDMCLDGNDGSIYVLPPGVTCDPSPGNAQTTMLPYFIPNAANSSTSWAPYSKTTSPGYISVALADGNTTRGNNVQFQMLWYSSIALGNITSQASTVTLNTTNGLCSSLSTAAGANLDLMATINVNISTPTAAAGFDMPTLGYFGIYTTLNQTLNANNTGYMGAISQESSVITASAPYANTILFGQTQFVQLNCTSQTFNYFFNGTQVFPYGQYQIDTDSYVLSYYATKNDSIAALYGDSPWVNTFVPFSPTFWS